MKPKTAIFTFLTLAVVAALAITIYTTNQTPGKTAVNQGSLNTSLVAVTDPNSKYDYTSQISRNVTASFQTKKDNKPSYVISYAPGKASLTFTLDTQAQATTIKENTAEYQVVVQNIPMIMRLTTTQDKVKEEFVIKQKPPNLETNLEITEDAQVQGLDLQQDGSTGPTVFKSQTGSQTYTLPQPTVFDESNRQTKIQGVFSKDSQAYTITVPLELLKNSSYPLTIDPAVILSNPATDPASVMRQSISEKYPQAVEVVGKRNENSKTFDLNQGSRYDWSGSLGEIHYKDDPKNTTEAWKEIDTQIEPADSSTGYDYQNITNNFKSYFKKNSTDPDTVKYEDSGSTITFTNVDSGELGTLKSAEGVATDNRFVYPEAYDNVDIKYSIGSRILLEEFVLKQPGNVSQISQKVHIENATYKKQADGSFNFYSTETKELVWSFPKPKMYEVNERPGIDGHPSRFENHGLHYEITRQGNNYTVTKVLDQEGKDWLNSPGRAYPLVIDTTLNLTVGADADDGFVWNVTFDNTGLVVIGLFSVADNDWFRFTGVTIANAATIDSAALTLKANSNGTASNIHAIQSAEAADNPAAPTSVADYNARTITSATVAWNPSAWVSGTEYPLPSITAVIQEIVNRGGWTSGNAIQLFVRGSTSTGEVGAQGFGTYSSKLDITYTVAAPTPTPTPTPTPAPKTSIKSGTQFKGKINIQ